MCRSNHRITVEAAIVNPQGLHARPVMKFVDLAARFQSSITVDRGAGTEAVDGKSPMHMMLLAAPIGSTLRITAEGADADDAASALLELIHRGFDEM